MSPFDKLKYNLTYDEQNTVQFKMKLNKIHDKDILDKLATVNKQGYIKQLIRADLVSGGNKMMGEYINQWYVTDEQTGKDHEYKTEQAAKKKYDSIQGHARLVRETNVVNQDITILEK